MNVKKLIIALLVPQLAGVAGSLFTVSAIPTWYAALIKPSFNPPNWIFGPVWLSLYFLMGVSAYLIWMRSENDDNAKKALVLFWIHLLVNTAWSIIFFGLHNILFAFITICILLVFIGLLIFRFWKSSVYAAYLLIPYFLWVSFATILNFSILTLN